MRRHCSKHKRRGREETTDPGRTAYQRPIVLPMRVEPVDERDSGWEDPSPRFRIHLFSGDEPGHATSTYDVIGGDVLDAIRWAQKNAGSDRMYSVALVRDEVRADGETARGLVWLVGMDANDSPRSGTEQARRAAMLHRRGHKVVTE